MQFAETQQPEVAELFFRKADETGQQARVVHQSILKQEALSGDLQFEKNKFG
ncbi:MAG: chemotaxis protein CheB [Hymenobacter sp.]|nr:chemotaxis protein CheB [Hymenobacter sp.]